MGHNMAKASDAGKELCEVLGIDWRNVYMVVVSYQAGEAVRVVTKEFAEDSSGRFQYVINEQHDDIVRIMRNYELVEKGVEEI